MLIICPMRTEADALGSLRGARIEVSGPGPKSMRRYAESLASRREPPARRVILAGIAGGLSDAAAPGSARWVRDVRSASGATWTSPTPTPPDAQSAWTVVGSDRLVGGRENKRRLAEDSGAHIVDMESHVFAEIAERCRWSWAIARGVSDGVDEILPDDLMDLIDAEGRPRIGRALGRMALRPTLAPTLWHLSRRTRMAMASVRALLLPLVEGSRR